MRWSGPLKRKDPLQIITARTSPQLVPRVMVRRILLASLISCLALASSQPLQAGPPLPLLTPTPYMGWNTWYGLGVSFDEGAITSTVDQLVRSGLKDAGYSYVWLDAGWW